MNKNELEPLKPFCDDDWNKVVSSPTSTRKLKWKCSRCGTHYESMVRTMLRAEKLTGWPCPVCADLVLVKGYNDLKTKYPAIADRLEPGIDPEKIIYSKKGALRFVCDKGHVFNKAIAKMLKDDSCPICHSGGYLSENVQLVSEWDIAANIADPNTPSSMDGLLVGSNKRAHWVCSSCGHKWINQIFNRGIKHQGCPKCANLRISEKAKARYARKSPLSDYKEVAEYWDTDLNEDTPEEISATSPAKRWFKCANGHTSLRVVRDVVETGFMCKACGIADPITNYDDLMTYYDDSRDPETISRNNYYSKIRWLCPVCHQRFVSPVKTMFGRLRSRGTMCPICGCYELVPGVNDLATTRPDLTSELVDSTRAGKVTEYSNDKLEWKCMTNPDHPPYTTTPRQRVNGVNCKTCTALRRAAENNRTRLREGQSDPIPNWIMDYAIPEDRKRMIDRCMSAGSSETVTIIYPDCGHERSTTICNMGRSPECPICAFGMHMSKGQDELTEWLRSILGQDAVQSNQSGLLDGRKELDIYIPSMKTAIEYNGLYWHNEEHAGRRATFDKWKACKDKGIRLLTIWDDDWNYRKDLVKRTVKSILLGPTENHDSFKSYVHPSEALARAFMDRNHLGRYEDAPYRIAVMGEDHRFLAMMISSMDDHTGTFTISAYADVYGDGWFLANLLDKVRSDVKPQKMRADLDHCLYDGTELNRFGFIDYAEKEPEFFLTDGNHMVRHYDSDSMDGFYRVYDAGSTTMILPNAHK